MKKIIYTTEISDDDLKYAKERLEDQNRSTKEEDVWEEASIQNNFWLQDEKSNLSKLLEGDILVIADLGLWNRRTSGYKIMGNNVKDILSSLPNGEVEFFADTKDKQVKAIQNHHDGTNFVTFREIKPNVNIQNLCDKIYNNTATSRDISRYTRSLYPHVASVYGW